MKYFIVFALICLAFNPASAESGPLKTKSVLVLLSYDYGVQYQELFIKGLQEKIKSCQDYNINLSYEYLDMDKYSSRDFKKELAENLHSKYISNNQDLVIAFYKPAFNFLLHYKSYLGFSGPFIYCTSVYPENSHSNILCISEMPDFKGTVETALKLLPETGNIAVVAGTTPSERKYAKVISMVLAKPDKNIHIIWLTNETLSGLLESVSKLPRNSFILSVRFTRGRDGITYDPSWILQRIHSISPVPIFTASDETMGTGATGGRMISYEQMGKAAGGSAIQFLKGLGISEIKTPDPAKYSAIFDWRELKRWGIPRATLPEGSEVRFREYTFLEKYFFELAVLAAVVLAESILIVFLLINITKRRAVQRYLRESESRYRGIIEESFEGICVTDEQGRIISWNRVMENITGVNSSGACDKFIWDMIFLSLNPGKIESGLYEHLKQELIKTLKTGISQITDKTFKQKKVLENGTFMFMETRLFSFATDKGYILIIIVLDITERKRSEKKIQNALEEKEALLRELYHRTKNNMQIINSLLNLEAGFFKDPGLKSIFQDMENRIHSMALVHQKLYQSKDLSRVYLKEYIDELVNRLKSVYVLVEGSINIVLDIENLPLQIDSAIPFGLILNELVSNSYKHGFLENTKGEIIISLHKYPEGSIKLIVCDNGIGVREGFDFRENSRMGLRSVFWIGEQQLRGEVIFEQANSGGGVKCTVSFNEINVTGGF